MVVIYLLVIFLGDEGWVSSLDGSNNTALIESGQSIAVMIKR